MSNINVLIIATRFPNTIQPWLANGVAQVVKKGGRATIFSLEKGDESYSSIVDQFSLKEKTITLHLDGKNKIITIIKNFTFPSRIARSFYGIIVAKRNFVKTKSFIKNIFNSLALAPYFKQLPIDIIHSHFEITGHQLLPIIKSQNKPFVITFHGFPPFGVTEIPQAMRAELLSHADTILVNTNFAKQQYIQVGAPERKIQIIPQGIITKNFIFTPKAKPENAPVEILTVGRLSVDKGHIYALQAVALLKAKGYSLNYTILGCGSGQAELESAIKTMDLTNEVKILPPMSGAPLFKLFSAAHIFILPSISMENNLWQETQGVVIQEAQASGAIVIATKTGGIPECVEDGKSAFLVEDRNANAIADKAQWIIDNPQQWNEWQHSARKYVETNFDIEIIGNRLMQIYTETIEKFKKNH